jgi:CRP-like cAMP-binding protein
MLLNYQPTQTKAKLENIEEKRLYFYEKGETIPLIESGLWQVDRGAVQLSKLETTGEYEIVLGWAIPETSFGMWMTDIPNYRAEAIDDVYLRWFSQAEIESSVVLSRIFVRQLSRRLLEAEELFSIAAMRRVEDRLWQLLLFLKEKMGKPMATGSKLSIRLTHHNLAGAICTTRVTVTRILGSFQRRGLIDIDLDRHFIIIDN